MKTVNKTVRLTEAMVDAAERWGSALGLTFTDVVELALISHLNLAGNPSFELVEAVRDYLLGKYPERLDFPQDVTLEVFKHIRDDTKLRALYEQALAAGPDREEAVASLHRRLGKAVKLVLNATVVGRSLPLDPVEFLITTHALLIPTVQ